MRVTLLSLALISLPAIAGAAVIQLDTSNSIQENSAWSRLRKLVRLNC